jgi:hypothetical protein
VVVVVVVVVVVMVVVVGVVVVVPPVMAVLMYALRDRRKCIRSFRVVLPAFSTRATRFDSLRWLSPRCPAIVINDFAIRVQEGGCSSSNGYLLVRPLKPSQ